MDPEAALKLVKARIRDLEDTLKPLRDERQWLEGILAGPRVQPVGIRFGGREETYDDLDDAFYLYQADLDNGYPPVEKVTVGGAEVTYNEWRDANPDKRWW